MKKTLMLIIVTVLLCFAQDTPEKLAVYVSGASDVGINKSLSSKLLVALTQSGKYMEIADPGSFQDEFTKGGKGGAPQIPQVAKKHGADYVCVVNMIQAFGAYSISARLIKVADFQVVKTGSTDHILKSLDDLNEVSNELAQQLVPSNSPQPIALVPIPTPIPAPTPTPIPAPAPTPIPTPAPIQPVAAVVVPEYAKKKQCAQTFNINEIISKLKGFPNQLTDCSKSLAKEMALASMPFGKKAAPVEPRSYMRMCSVDGIKRELPQGFPEANRLIGSVDNFVQKIMNLASSANGQIDPQKLISTVGNIDINGFLGEVRGMLANAECIVDEVYTPAAQVFNYSNSNSNSYAEDESSSSEFEKDGNKVSLGIRTGLNTSWIYAEYSNSAGSSDVKVGVQLGMVLDIPISEVFHIQPGLVYVRKGTANFINMNNYGSNYTFSDRAANYLEIPMLLSLKLSMFRLNVGPYLGMCLVSDDVRIFNSDFGINVGLGLDINMFYVGMFFDYGLTNMSNDKFYNVIENRTIGLDVGINL